MFWPIVAEDGIRWLASNTAKGGPEEHVAERGNPRRVYSGSEVDGRGWRASVELAGRTSSASVTCAGIHDESLCHAGDVAVVERGLAHEAAVLSSARAGL